MKKILILAVSLTYTMACVKESEQIHPNSCDSAVEIVLQERDSRLPETHFKPFINRISRAASEISVDNFTGRGYAIGNTMIGEDVNASKFPIVNLEAIRNSSYSTLLSSLPTRRTIIETFSYNDWERYAEKHTFSKKITSGFQLNVKLFKIGKKSTFTERFSKYNMEENRSVYGELNIEYQYSLHAMQSSPASRKIIAANFLEPVFLENLYGSTMKSVRDNFGDFVITGYYSGGRATALYAGEYTGTESYEAREKKMDATINASIGFKKDSPDSLSLALQFAGAKGDSVSRESSFSSMYAQINTFGGLNTATDILGKPIAEVSINLNSWLQSLSTQDNHTLIGITEQGLSPLSGYVLEENFAVRLSDLHWELISDQTGINANPLIEIVKLYVRKVGSEKLYDVVPILKTRHGDRFIIASTPSSEKTDNELRSYSDVNNFTAKAKEITAELGQHYWCRIVATPNQIINPILRNPLVFDLTGLNVNRMYKLHNPATNMYYICDLGSFIALAYHGSDPFIPWNYGIGHWVDQLPTHPYLTMTSLTNSFRIFGL